MKKSQIIKLIPTCNYLTRITGWLERIDTNLDDPAELSLSGWRELSIDRECVHMAVANTTTDNHTTYYDDVHLL